MASRIVAVGAALALVAGAAAAEPVARERVEAALPQIEAMAAKLAADGAVPGIAIAVVHGDAVVYLGGFGLREVGSRETVDADTVFQIASMSKPISATVVAKLVSDGVVEWDSRIADLNPGFRLHDPYPTAELTLTDLFNHRSGLPGTSGDDLEAIGFDRTVIGERLRLVPPSSSFRAGYAYSNAGLTQGALAAAMAAGQPWETVAEERLYRPLGMASTSSRHADFVARDNRAGAARALAGPLGGAGRARPRPAGAGRRRQLDGARPRAVDAARARERRLARARRSSRPTRSPRPTSRCSTAATTRSAAAPPSTPAAGTWSSAGTGCPGATPGRSATACARS